jgi:hypothetical protein
MRAPLEAVRPVQPVRALVSQGVPAGRVETDPSDPSGFTGKTGQGSDGSDGFTR